MATPPLLQLPIELLDRIAFYLSARSFCNLRLTCRPLADGLDVQFRAFFAKKQFMMAECSLQGLVDMSKSRVGPFIKDIQFKALVIPVHNASLFETPEAWRFQQRHIAFVSSGAWSHMLVEAMSNLPGLQKLTLRDCDAAATRLDDEGRSLRNQSYGSAQMLRELSGWDPRRHDRPDRLEKAISDLLSACLLALAKADSPATEIEVICRRGASIDINVLSLTLGMEPIVDSFLKRLKVLHICTNIVQCAVRLAIGDTEAERPQTTLIGFLLRCPNLVELRVNDISKDEVGVSSFLKMLAQSNPWLPRTQGSRELLASTSVGTPPLMLLTKLQDLSLGCFETDMALICKVLKRFAPTLRRLSLWKITLVEDNPRAGLDKDEYDRLWSLVTPRALQELADVPDVSLNFVQLGALKQHWPPGRYTAYVTFDTEVSVSYSGTDWRSFVRAQAGRVKVGGNGEQHLGSGFSSSISSGSSDSETFDSESLDSEDDMEF